MTRLRARRAAAVAILLSTLAVPAVAQEGAEPVALDRRSDSLWNGTTIGLGIGAGLAFLPVRPEGVRFCESGVRGCAIDMMRAATFGGAAGAAIDALANRRISVVPGTRVDDRATEGALIGAGAGVVVGLTQALGNRCIAPNRQPCTPKRRVLIVLREALFGAAFGALVDLANPTRSR
jgi:hypothetical protein